MTRSTLLLTLAAALALPLPAQARGAKITASSAYKTSQVEYTADKAFDGRLDTAWGEDKLGPGLGEWIEIDLGKPQAIRTLSLWGGAFGGTEEWGARSRLSKVTLTLTGPDGEVKQEVTLPDRFARTDVDLKPKQVQKIRVTIDQVYEGSVFTDSYLAEIAFDFADNWKPEHEEALEKAIAKDRTWRELAAGSAAQEVDAAWQACQDNTDYSKNFKVLGWTAAHGLEYRTAAVNKAIPPGYRLAFLGFDEDNVVRLGKLKDANAIKYLEIAAAGALDEDRAWLESSIKYFEAYAQLRRTPRATLPNWGTTGLEPGAFMGRGEGLAIDVDLSGNLWIADVGNNRVQSFSSAGSAESVIGAAERGIVDSWFGSKDTPYAAGAAAGKEAGQFTQPVALAVGNYDILAVVDADLRVQTFDDERKPMAQWTLDTKWRPRPGLGLGTPIVTWLDDDFYFLVDDEVLVYGPDGTKKTSYKLEGGAIQAGVIVNGKLVVRHVGSRDLMEYVPADGFRRGLWTKQGVPEDGSSDWELATDADDNLYVLTDAGKVYKWNKRGKFLKDFKAMENSKDVPRMAVDGPFIYITANDTILRVEQE